MRDPSKIVAMMQVAQTQFGDVGVLIDNAGIRHFATVQNFPIQQRDDTLAINLFPAFHISRLAIPMAKIWLGTYH